MLQDLVASQGVRLTSRVCARALRGSIPRYLALLIRSCQRSQPIRNAAKARFFPSGVFGPVLIPPWNLHLLPRNSSLHWQGTPSLFLAPQILRSFLRPFFIHCIR